MMATTTTKRLQSILSEIFIRDAYCSSTEEAGTIAQLVVESKVEDGGVGAVVEDDDHTLFFSEMLQDYLGITAQEALVVQNQAISILRDGDGDEDQSETDEEADNNELDDDKGNEEAEHDDDDDDDMIIGDGECVLCERYIQVTKHHLIPKSTWSRLEKSIRNAIAAEKKSPASRFLVTEENDFLAEGITDVKQIRKSLLSRTCDVCRPCHSTIHRTHDNMTLAIHYNTVEKLLSDETIHKFCKWANKQRPGKYARKDQR